MNTIASVIAFLAALSPESNPVVTSTELLAAAPPESVDVSVGLAGVSASHVSSGVTYALAGAAVLAGGIILLNDGNDHHHSNPVPEPATMAVLGIGVVGLARRRRALR